MYISSLLLYNKYESTDIPIANMEVYTMAEKKKEELLTLREGAAYLGVTDQRMRTILREGRVEATKNEKGYWRLTTEALDDYNENKGRRLDGGKTWTIRLSPEQHVALTDFIDANPIMAGVELSERYNYDPAKAKAYRQKRKAQLAAEAALAQEASE